MKLLIMGPPGAGKGTQAAILADRFGLAHLSSGDILRKSVKAGEELGKQAKSYMDSGGLVPDELMISLILNEVLSLVDSGRGFLLDGFPRTLGQARSLAQAFADNEVSIESVINLKVSDEIVVDRLSGRRVCPECARVYHVRDLPPKIEGVCDVHSEAHLITRSDDTESVIRQRLKVYLDNTKPILDYYENSGLVLDINGNQDKTEITQQIVEQLGSGAQAAGA